MTSAIVVDASVAAKWFLVEQDSIPAAALLTGDHDLGGPSLLAVEIAAAISRRFRQGGIDEADARRKLEHARRFIAAPSIHLVSDTHLLARASEMSIQIRHPLQDCLYIACAEHLNGDFVTADETLLSRALPHFSFVKAL